jgi:hypothetical protein
VSAKVAEPSLKAIVLLPFPPMMVATSFEPLLTIILLPAIA